MYKRLLIRLEQDIMGWPPITEETIWGEPLESGNYKISSIPFFADGIAHGDVVSVEANFEESILRVSSIMQEGGNSTIRVVGTNGTTLQEVLQIFDDLEIDFETLEAYGIAAFNIPFDRDLIARFKGRLVSSHASATLDYDEGCVSEAWKSVQL